MEVRRKGRVKDAGGIKGVNIDYSFLLENLTDGNSDIKNFRKIKTKRNREGTL